MCSLWFLGGVVALIFMALVALYIPAVQRWVKDLALEKVNAAGTMRISVGDLRLRFPLHIAVDDVTVENAPGDTMATVTSFDADARVLPLLRGVISIDGAAASGVRYRLGTPDSVMYLCADVRSLRVGSAAMHISGGLIDVDRATLDGGRVSLDMKEDTTVTPVDSAASAPLTIRAGLIHMRSVEYSMTMAGLIDSLGATIGDAVLRNGEVAMATRSIRAQSLAVDSLTAAYIYPLADAETRPAAAADSMTELPVDTLLWTVRADTVRLDGGHALYALTGAEPQPGLDMNYLQAYNVGILVTDFFNRGTAITVPLQRLHAVERCGIQLDADGTFMMDSTGMEAKNFRINTLHSTLTLNAMAGITAARPMETAPVMIDAHLQAGMADAALAYPALAPAIRKLPQRTPLQAVVRADGRMDSLTVDSARIWMQRVFDVSVDGRVADMTDMDRISGHMEMSGKLANTGFIKQTLFDAQMRRLVDLPPLSVHAGVDMHRGTISGKMRAVTGAGRVALDGTWVGRTEAYSAGFRADSLPVKAFLPTMGIGSVTARAGLSGHGLDVFSPRTELKADIAVERAEYLGRVYRDIDLDATLADGRARASLSSRNAAANLDMTVDAGLSADEYTWDASGRIRNLDLRVLGMADTTMAGRLTLRSSGRVLPKESVIDATVDVDSLYWSMPGTNLRTGGLRAMFASTDSSVRATVDNGGLHALFTSPQGLDSMMARIASVTAVVDRIVAERRVDVVALQHALPQMRFYLNASGQSILSDYLRGSDMSVNSLHLSAANDSLMSLNAQSLRIKAGSTRIDTVTVDLHQRSKYLIYNLSVGNRPGTMDEFAHVGVRGYMADDKMALLARQNNIQGNTGYKLGLVASADSSGINIKLTPATPIIAYKDWTINSDNFIHLNIAHKHLDANLDMAGAGSRVRLYTEHSDSTDTQEDVILSVSDLQLADWLAMSPFAPPVKGAVDADMRFGWDDKSLTGTGNVGLRDLVYGRERVGSFDLGVDLATTAGVIRADASLLVDSIKVITARGSLNDSTSATPFNLDFSMIHLPLRILNPFLPADMARLSGMLNGKMEITGDLAHPVFNGYIDFDSTAVRVPMMGTDFRFSEEKVPVVDNVVTFDRYTISAVNENPLYIDGTVAFRDISAPVMDLKLNARNMQVVGNKRGRGADIYGKAFIDADVSVRGTMALMIVDADLSVLRGTNVTYVMSTDASTAITSRSSGDMVRFVNFSDSLAMADADTIQPTGMAMVLDATLGIRQGAVVNVDLSTDGKNKVQLNGEGTLQYSSSPLGDSRMTGRYTINSGFVRYSMPMISEMTFNFDPGSYVAFNGDMLNPTLHVSAIDLKRANVTREGQNSRLVNFDIGLSVTGTLEDMNVAFDLSTRDDITVQNELQSMSAEQRANQAMNLLLYNVYTGPGTKANANLSGNPLYSFLTSQVNTWMANNIRGVDISFGVDQYDRTYGGSTSTAMSYSYRVSKSMFNDRFKIVVGGNYSTDADADENFSQNLINDISFEYMLNRSGSMVVKIFRHTGYESILEGEVTQTGVGFVYKHKLSRLGDMFRFLRRKERN